MTRSAVVLLAAAFLAAPAVAQREALLAEARALEAASRNVPADPVSQAGLARAADDLVARVRAEWSSWPSGDCARVARSLHTVFGSLGRNVGGLLPAMDLLEDELRRRPGSVDGWATALVWRGWTVRERGAANETALAWDQLWRRATGPKRIWLACEAARVLINKCGRATQAESVLGEALAELAAMPEWDDAARRAIAADVDVWITSPWRPRAGSWREARGQALLLRAFAREQMGRLVPALADLAAAAEDFTWSGYEHRLANCRHNLASIWLQLGRFDLAAEVAAATAGVYERGFQLAAPDLPRERDGNGAVAMRKVQAQALLSRGLPGDAEAAVAMLEAVRADPDLWMPADTNADAFTSLAEALLRLPQSAARDERVLQALEPVRAFAGPAPDALVHWRAELLRAELDLQRGAHRAAHDRLDAIVEPLARHRHRPLQVQRLALVGRCELAAGEPQAAMATFTAAAELVVATVLAEEMWRVEGAASAFAAQFGSLLADAKAAADAEVAAGAPAPAVLAQLYALAQRFHGFEAWCRSLVDATDSASAPPEPLDERVRDAHAEYARLLRLQPRHPLAQRERLRQLALAQRAVETNESLLAAWRRRSGLAERVAPFEPVELAAVQAALADGEVLVECVEAGATAFAFVLTRAGLRIEPLPHGAAWRARCDDVVAFRDGDDATTDPAAVPALAALSAMLWPAGGWFDALLADGGVRRVLWSPEGSFALAPLAALPWRGRPLVAAREVANVVSGSFLARRRQAAESTVPARTPADWRLLALGNPRYPETAVRQVVERSLADRAGFAALPASAKEALGVAQGFATAAEAQELAAIAEPARVDGELRGGRYRVLLGAAATESALASSALRAVDVLHFACHGEAQPDAPAMSFLALTLPAGADGAEDGVLRAGELGRLRGDYQLVALSACRTAAGSVRGHDGVAGLAWAAQMAGARRVLASQWQVPDDGARDLVLAFYRRWLRDGEAPAAALAGAQREALGRVPVRTWAAFALWGEPQ
jgi:tetratricopeptide (TPR) repeat protein